MAEEKKYNWANWDIKEQPKIELKDIPEESKKERTAAERQEEIDNIKAAMLRNRYWDDNYRAIDNLSPKDKAYYKPKVKPYGRFKSYLMDNKVKIALYSLAMFFFALSIGLLFTKGTSLEMPTQLLVFLTTGSAIIGFGLLFFAVESD